MTPRNGIGLGVSLAMIGVAALLVDEHFGLAGAKALGVVTVFVGVCTASGSVALLDFRYLREQSRKARSRRDGVVELSLVGVRGITFAVVACAALAYLARVLAAMVLRV